MTLLAGPGATLIATVGDDSSQQEPEIRECARGKCHAPALDDSEFCDRCRIAERLRVAQAMARLRKKRRGMGRCSFCGVKLRATDLPKKTAKTASCRSCRKERDREIHGVTGNVTSRADRIATRTVIDAGNRVRYRGQARRGRMSVADENRMDFDAMERDLARARDEDTDAESAEAKALPRIQRIERKRKAMDWVVLLVRTGLSVLRRNDKGLAKAVEEQIADSDDGDET